MAIKSISKFRNFETDLVRIWKLDFATSGATDFEIATAATSRAATSAATDFEIATAATSRAATSRDELGPRILKSPQQELA